MNTYILSSLGVFALSIGAFKGIKFYKRYKITEDIIEAKLAKYKIRQLTASLIAGTSTNSDLRVWQETISMLECSLQIAKLKKRIISNEMYEIVHNAHEYFQIYLDRHIKKGTFVYY